MCCSVLLYVANKEGNIKLLYDIISNTRNRNRESKMGIITLEQYTTKGNILQL